jgi:hypothetical protein
MKTSATVIFISILGCWLCSCGPADTCGPFPQGYNWERKALPTSIPFYPDSLLSDSIRIRFADWYYNLDSVKVFYSSTLDSFRITADALGTNFFIAGADTNWRPKHSYVWNAKQMDIYFQNYIPVSTQKNSQSPQCSPIPGDYLTVSNVSIEVPKTIKYVSLIR